MSPDPDPFEQGQRAARENIPAEQVAGAAEADESEGT
jgi:hypothetical protein